jgi:hypothetical protein
MGGGGGFFFLCGRDRTQGPVSVHDSNQYFCRSLAKISELYLTDDNKGKERPREKEAGQSNFDNSVSHN